MIRDRFRPRPARAPFVVKGPRPVLKMALDPVWKVHYKDLEAYVAKVYGLKYFDFKFAVGLKVEGSQVDYGIIQGQIPETDGYIRQIGDIRLGQKTRNVPLLLNLLVKDGYIPAGRYLILTNPVAVPSEIYRTMLMQTRDPLHPDCLAFKEQFLEDRAITELCGKLDNAMIERLKG